MEIRQKSRTFAENFVRHNQTTTIMNLLIYLSGVFVMFVISAQSYGDDRKFTVADLIDMVVFCGLSWITILFVATQHLTDWMRTKDHDWTIFKFKKYNND